MKKLLAALAAVRGRVPPPGRPRPLNVAATAVPHAEILEFVKPLLAKEGVTLEIKVFTDYVQPNVQVAEKHLDANFFQHQPYLDEFNKAASTDAGQRGRRACRAVRRLLAASSSDLDELPDGANVAIPNDATNGGRALLLLAEGRPDHAQGSDAGITATPRDIAEQSEETEVPRAGSRRPCRACSSRSTWR